MGSYGGYGSTQGALATKVSSAAFPLLAPAGSAAAPSYAFGSTGGSDDGIYSSANNRIDFAVGGANLVRFSTAGIQILDDSDTLSFGASSDVILVRDAAAVLALKNGTTAQTFRVYNTYTDASNYERLNVGFSSNVGVVLVGALGTGASRSLSIGTDSTSSGALNLQTAGTNRWTVDGGGTDAGRLAAGSNYGFSHGTSALATTATEGFFHLQSCAGAPTGVPASIPTGQVPFVLDTTNDRLYFYYDDGGGAGWHYISRTA